MVRWGSIDVKDTISGAVVKPQGCREMAEASGLQRTACSVATRYVQRTEGGFMTCMQAQPLENAHAIYLLHRAFLKSLRPAPRLRCNCRSKRDWNLIRKHGTTQKGRF
jgi:hypothetical protein